MAQVLTPRQSIICALMICVFPHAGISNKGLLSITQTTEGGTLLLTCRLPLTGSTKVSQTGWEMDAGPNNRTNLGTFHPLYGTHIPPQYREQVQIQSTSSEPNITTLRLTDWQTNQTDRFCCAFHTFPSGKLERCISIRQSNAESDVLTQNVMAQGDQRLASRVIIVAGGAVLALGLLSLSIFFCWRSSLKRWGEFEVESAHSAEAQQPAAEVQAESAPQPTVNLGFDPSKLYAKIKQDLYYGRLWKSYQGRPQTRDPGPGPPAMTPRKVYSFVGEHSPAQKNQEEP